MSTFFTEYAWLIPLLPFVAFILLTGAGKSLGKTGAWIGTVASFASLVLALCLATERMASDAPEYSKQFEWITIGKLKLMAGFEVTNLSTLMLVVVTLVAFLVNLYSQGYMKKDERISTFYAYVALFTSSMLGLVLADNLLTFYIFWELVGVCSFLLVGFSLRLRKHAEVRI